MTSTLYPLLFEPVLKDYIWGGRNLATRLGRALPDGKIAESWEIAAHPDGDALVANGALAGRSLSTLVTEYGLDLVGTRSRWAYERGKFPLLVKLLDANRRLSVQVHPDDAYAQEHEGNELGKTEMWVVLHAEPDAAVILGVRENTTPAAFRDAIAAGTLDPLLHRLPVKTGDHVNVPAGSVHAILNGLLIAEIQQNSNTTYRVYDWNRVGHDGQPRPLHIDRALEVINFEQVAPPLPHAKPISNVNGVRRALLNRTPYFSVERVELTAGTTFTGRCDGSTFEIWGVIQGAAVLDSASPVSTPLTAVQFALIPAAQGVFALTARTDTTCLRTYVDDPR